MGYDMYVVAEDMEGFVADLGEVNQENIERYAEWRKGVDERDGYFRLNIWGMGSMRHLLWEAGCLAEMEMPWNGDEPIVDADTGGVLPFYKISDNSGWLVTPAECIATAMTWFEGGGREKARVIAKALATEWSAEEGEEYTDDKVLAWADDFVQWIGMAAGRGGFRVY